MPIAKEYTIAQLIEKFEGAKTVIHEYGSLPNEVVNYKLNPSTWSCVEVCQHLIRFNQIYLDEMENALQEHEKVPANINGQSKFSPNWVARKLAGYMEPPYKFGIPTIKPMNPDRIHLDPAETFQRLIETENEFIDMLEKAEIEKWILDKIKGRHPVVKVLKISLTDILILTDAHQRRHFWQIEQILKRIPDQEKNNSSK